VILILATNRQLPLGHDGIGKEVTKHMPISYEQRGESACRDDPRFPGDLFILVVKDRLIAILIIA
jgi:hypothetical protein